MKCWGAVLLQEKKDIFQVFLSKIAKNENILLRGNNSNSFLKDGGIQCSMLFQEAFQLSYFLYTVKEQINTKVETAKMPTVFTSIKTLRQTGVFGMMKYKIKL